MKTYTRVYGGGGYQSRTIGQVQRSDMIYDAHLPACTDSGSDVYHLRMLEVGEAYLCTGCHTWVRLT